MLKVIKPLVLTAALLVPLGATAELTGAQENAVRAAERYLEFSGFSKEGLIHQLSSEFGDRFEREDARIAVESLEVDWRAQAVRSAEQYLEFSAFSCQGLIDQLSSSFGDRYTEAEARYGAGQTPACN